MTNPNDPAFTGPTDNGYTPGLTKLELLAATMSISEADVTAFAHIVMDEPRPEPCGTKHIEWWLDAESKLRIMKAKSLIKELNKRP